MRLVVHLPEELARRLEAAAAERGVSPEQVAVEAIEARLPVRRQLSFIGIGHSGGTESVAERHREIIREHFRRQDGQRRLSARDRWPAPGDF